MSNFLRSVAVIGALSLILGGNAQARDNKTEQYDRYRNEGFDVQEVKHFGHLDMAAAVAAIGAGQGPAYFNFLSREVVAKAGESVLREALANPNRVFNNGECSFQFKVITINHWHMESVPRVKWSGVRTTVKWEDVKCPEPNTASLVLLIKRN
jgi:hypothetical protein